MGGGGLKLKRGEREREGRGQQGGERRELVYFFGVAANVDFEH